MQVQSLGYRTDLIFFRHGRSRIRERDGYLVIESPENPTFHWGNFLLFPAAPRPGDDKRWAELFDAEFRHAPEVRHRAFGWDDPRGKKGQIRPFLEAGYEFDESLVLTAAELEQPVHFNEDVTVRPLLSDDDWDAVTARKIEVRPGQFSKASYSRFMRRHMQQYRRLVKQGLGFWFGAFLQDRLAGDLGLFADQGVGRYQSVDTYPEFRRRGVCRTLVHVASRITMERLPIRTLVIVAAAGAPVVRVYQSLGFQPTERQVGLSWSYSDS